MNLLKCSIVGAAALSVSVLQIPAQVLYSDGFESYHVGALDANLTGGPNQAPNGGPGDPWFGPLPPNMQVVASGDGGVAAHSGAQMIRGNIAGSDFDQDWYNLAARLNGSANLQGNIALDWWFYDPLGSGGSNFRDYMALGNYTSASGTAGLDYPASSGGNLNPGGANQRLSLGASNPTGYSASQYQARVVGATDGLGGGQWFNVGTRSVGWHEGEIVVGSPNGAGTAVSFYIDGVDVLDHALDTTGGLNVIEINGAFGATVGYFDDLTMTAIPEPGTAALLVCGGLALLAVRRRK